MDHKELTLQIEKDQNKKNTILAVSNENKKRENWEIAPEKFQENKMGNEELVNLPTLINTLKS